jgi:peptide/nickel transport system permease protein
MATTTATAGALVLGEPTPPTPVFKRLGQAALVIATLATIVLLLFPGLIAHTSPIATSDNILKPPSSAYWFGTDVFSRTVYGARPVLVASLLGVVLATLAGVALGVVAGVSPRWLNSVIMRIIDVLLALPVLLIALILISVAGAGIPSIVIAIGVAFTPGFARIVEASVRTLRSVEYVQAARVMGSTGARTSFRHLIPNLMTEVVVLGTSAIGWAVLTATTLSFLGLGVQLPQPDWGSDLAAGANQLSTAWWLSTFPGLAITITILAANFVGDYLMTALDPRDGVRFSLSTMLTGRSRRGGLAALAARQEADVPRPEESA